MKHGSAVSLIEHLTRFYWSISDVQECSLNLHCKVSIVQSIRRKCFGVIYHITDAKADLRAREFSKACNLVKNLIVSILMIGPANETFEGKAAVCYHKYYQHQWQQAAEFWGVGTIAFEI